MADGTVAADQLRLFIERIERLEEEKKGIADDIRDVYAEAKANGYDTKTMRIDRAPAHDGDPRPPGSGRVARNLSRGARASVRKPPWPVIPNSRTSCTARARRIRSARRCSPSLSREITVAAKMGLPDPDMNARLRAAVLAAKAQSMPKDNIQRSIDKASAGDAENYEEIRYEGFGPGGVALIVEALTDNRNRTATNVRTAFSKNGGNLGASGASATASSAWA